MKNFIKVQYSMCERVFIALFSIIILTVMTKFFIYDKIGFKSDFKFEYAKIYFTMLTLPHLIIYIYKIITTRKTGG